VVSVEAARHAIGRIADITADKHMEGVRLTRWILSPLPTFLLWRRMKLWELRSYEQVIKLEQERLVYQARLRSRFGRAWRRKAPVESLMPLRLARYGVPLAETTPSGLAAAGIEEPVRPGIDPIREAPHLAAPEASPVAGIDGGVERLALSTPAANEPTPVPASQPSRARQSPAEQIDANGVLAEAYQTWRAHFQMEPTPRQFAGFLRDEHAITTGAGHPLSDEQVHPILVILQKRYATSDEPATLQVSSPDPVENGDGDVEWEEFFFRAWEDYGREHGLYPDAAQLADYVFQRDGITGVGGRLLAGSDIESFVDDFWKRELGDAAPDLRVSQGGGDLSIPAQAGARDEPVETAGPAAAGTRRRELRVPIEPDPSDEGETAGDGEPVYSPGERGVLTTVDRYYFAWADYLSQHGQEPKDRQLSTFLAEKHGVLGRGGQGVSPSTLRRYLPGFRIFAAWSALREHNPVPTAQDVVRECATREISVRKSPVTAEMIEADLLDFERRWHVLAQHERRISSTT
ncbi:DUF2637 domain-containing protein, partial [Streptomyces sp. NPDC005195]|uniref:DUF2637 domain-containing protein n=1 Tax=Streptomyces sp. NPDC005195 TaxID=3154561 RepID=UPI0033A42D8B